MHVDTKTMHRVTDKIRAELAPWVRDPPKWALSEERRQASSGRIARLHGSAPYQKCGLEVRFSRPLPQNFLTYPSICLIDIQIVLLDGYC
jgi:hypothetical protein